MTRRGPFSLALAAVALLAASAAAPTDPAHAQEAPQRESAQAIPYKQEPDFGEQLIKLGFALAVVAVVGAVVIGTYRRLSGVRPGSPARRLKVLETLRLAPRTVLFLVEFDRRTLLIGQHGDRLTLLVGTADSGLPPERTERERERAHPV